MHIEIDHTPRYSPPESIYVVTLFDEVTKTIIDFQSAPIINIKYLKDNITFWLFKKAKFSYTMGLKLEEHEKYNEAIKYFEDALKFDTSNGDICIHLGHCYEMIRGYKKAQVYYKIALKYYDREINKHPANIKALESMKKCERALERIEKEIQ
jgi:tetratricopeptide (TPR) repeat protein